jgi:transposase
LVLSDVERQTLVSWSRRRNSAQALALRCRIVLMCADGLSNTEVARQLAVSRPTVGKWRSRFVERRLNGLVDEPRPGAPHKITDEQVERVVVATLEQTPTDATHWSRASMARNAGLSRSTVGRIWKAFRLKPHLSETFKLSKDPLFIDKVRDVVGLYLDPPQRAVVLCVDEKAQMQALDRSQPVLPIMPGMPEKRTHDYTRHGITSLFAALDMATGTVIGALHRRHRSTEYRKFLIRIDKAVPTDLDVHIICDNYATHKTDIIQTWLATHPRFTVHVIPTGTSWLNMVERWFAELTTKLLQRGVHKTAQALEADIRAWIDTWNNDPRPYIWTKTADEILDAIATFCQRTSDAGH